MHDLALERAAARLYALRTHRVDGPLTAWASLLPTRKAAMREEVRLAHRWFEEIAGSAAGPATLDPRVQALLCPRLAIPTASGCGLRALSAQIHEMLSGKV